MLTEILRWSCNLLIVVLLVRAVSGRFFSKYLVFYLYLAHVLLLSLLRFFFFVLDPKAYGRIYWYTEFISVAVGYCVIWEIYEQALGAYPGTIRMARSLIWALFTFVVAKALTSAISGSGWLSAGTVGELERNVRAVQASLLVVLVGLVSYYMIPVGRNLWGIIFGYGFFIAVAGIINMTIRAHFGEIFQLGWRYLQSSAYLLSLLIWSVSLWSYYPNPKPNEEIEIERDYELISARTARAIGKARGFVVRAVRP